MQIDGDIAARSRLHDMVDGVTAHDDLARAHRDEVIAWIASGAPLWRTAKPDVPLMHLVSYFLLRDVGTGRMLLVDHRNAGLMLPTGGHVEPGEDPWDTVMRECQEELRHTPAQTPKSPAFLTSTRTRGPGTHTDVSLWWVVDAAESDIGWHDPAEFSGTRWLTRAEVMAMPVALLDPHMHRFLESGALT